MDEIQDEKIKLWYDNLPEAKNPSKVTPVQRDFIRAFLDSQSPTYGNQRASALQAGCAYGIPPRVTKYKVDRVVHQAMKPSIGQTIPRAVGKPELVDLSKNVLKKALEQEEDMHLAQDTAKFVLKSTKEFAEKQDLSGEMLGISGLNISFASFKKPDEIEEAEVVEPKKIENKIRRTK